MAQKIDLIKLLLMNSMWVTLHILWKTVLSHVFLWPTGSEWHCTFCERQSHCIFSYDEQLVSEMAHFVKGWQFHCIISYDQQLVSDIAHFVKGNLITCFPMTNSLWVTLHILWKGSLITCFHMTNRRWVILHILWKVASPHVFLWPTACEWHCTCCER